MELSVSSSLSQFVTQVVLFFFFLFPPQRIKGRRESQSSVYVLVLDTRVSYGVSVQHAVLSLSNTH